MANQRGTLHAIRGRQLSGGASLWWGGEWDRSPARKCGERDHPHRGCQPPPSPAGCTYAPPSSARLWNSAIRAIKEGMAEEGLPSPSKALGGSPGPAPR